MLKVAVIGCGNISGSHVPNWMKMENVRLTAVCDLERDRTERWLAKYPDLHIYTDYAEMMDQEKPDILDICLPTYLHVQYAEDAMRRGAHVLCEKPVGLTEDEAKSVYRTARETGRLFMVAQVLRFWNEYKYLKDVIETGRFGALHYGRMYRNGGYPKTSWHGWMMKNELSRMVLLDRHIHDLDFLVYAMGKPEHFDVFRRTKGVEDILTVIYRYGDAFVNAESTWYLQEDVPFTAGYFFAFDKASLDYDGKKLTVYPAEGGSFCPLNRNNAYEAEIRYFAECVEQDRPITMVTEDSLLVVMNVVDAIDGR